MGTTYLQRIVDSIDGCLFSNYITMADVWAIEEEVLRDRKVDNKERAELNRLLNLDLLKLTGGRYNVDDVIRVKSSLRMLADSKTICDYTNRLSHAKLRPSEVVCKSFNQLVDDMRDAEKRVLGDWKVTDGERAEIKKLLNALEGCRFGVKDNPRDWALRNHLKSLECCSDTGFDYFLLVQRGGIYPYPSRFVREETARRLSEDVSDQMIASLLKSCPFRSDPLYKDSKANRDLIYFDVDVRNLDQLIFNVRIRDNKCIPHEGKIVYDIDDFGKANLRRSMLVHSQEWPRDKKK